MMKLFLNQMQMVQSIAEFLSANRTTGKARFEFAVPDTVEADLTACYRSVVEEFGCVFSLTPDAGRVLKSAANWLRAGKSGLLLTGGVGTGKSRLMLAINYLIRYYTGDLQRLKMFSAPKICDLARSKIDTEVETAAKLKTCRYVGIDDLGTEPIVIKNWGTELSPVIDILYARYDAGLATVITTNDGMDTIRSKYGERIHDRICEMYERIVFNFKSFRR
jgi:DNA replication protein DnaC